MIENIKQFGVFENFCPSDIQVTLIKKENHVYRIESPLGMFFLKTYTKS